MSISVGGCVARFKCQWPGKNQEEHRRCTGEREAASKIGSNVPQEFFRSSVAHELALPLAEVVKVGRRKEPQADGRAWRKWCKSGRSGLDATQKILLEEMTACLGLELEVVVALLFVGKLGLPEHSFRLGPARSPPPAQANGCQRGNKPLRGPERLLNHGRITSCARAHAQPGSLVHEPQSLNRRRCRCPA